MTSPSAREVVVPWCLQHRWALSYIAVVTTLGLILQILELGGVV